MLIFTKRDKKSIRKFTEGRIGPAAFRAVERGLNVANDPPCDYDQSDGDDCRGVEEEAAETSEPSGSGFDQGIEQRDGDQEEQDWIVGPCFGELAVECGMERPLESAAGTVVAGQGLECASWRDASGGRVVEVIKNGGDNRTDCQCDYHHRMFQSGFQNHSNQVNGRLSTPKTIEIIIVHSARSDILLAFS